MPVRAVCVNTAILALFLSSASRFLFIMLVGSSLLPPSALSDMYLEYVAMSADR